MRQGEQMVRKILKWLGLLVLAMLVLVAIYLAMHWRAVRNMARVSGLPVTDVSKFTPAQTVKGCSGTPLAPAPAGTLPNDTVAAMQDWSARHGGVGLLVLVDGKVASEAYAKSVTAQTRTQSNSMHKSVVALLMGAALADGTVKSADDPVGTYIPALKHDPRGAITLRQLLSMASGIKNPSMAKMDSAAFELMLGDVSDAALSLRAEGKPGIFNYNNANFQLAGTALANALQAAGKGSYAAYLSQKVWCPLGNGDGWLWLEFEGGNPRYFAYLNAALRDWARVGELVRLQGKWNGQQLVPADWVAAITAPSPGNPNYGMGVWRGSPWLKTRRYSKEVAMTVPQREAFLADDVIYFDGFGGQRVYVVPSARLVIARAGEPVADWDESALVNMALRGLGY
jgi:CubicO group peptidase (beta-lactamase class C family)